MKITLTAWLRKQMRRKIKVWSITKVRGLSKTRADELSTCAGLLCYAMLRSFSDIYFLSLHFPRFTVYQTFGDVGHSCIPSVSNLRTCDMNILLVVRTKSDLYSNKLLLRNLYKQRFHNCSPLWQNSEWETQPQNKSWPKNVNVFLTFTHPNVLPNQK